MKIQINILCNKGNSVYFHKSSTLLTQVNCDESSPQNNIITMRQYHFHFLHWETEIWLSSPVLSSVWFIKDLWTSNFCISSSLTTTYFQISLKHFLLFIFTSVASMSWELTTSKHSYTIQQDLNFKMSFFLCQNSPEMSIKLQKSQFYLNLYLK